MIDPDRVGQLVCMLGERVRVELGFRWDAEPQAVVANFRKFVGKTGSLPETWGSSSPCKAGRLGTSPRRTKRICRWY